MKRVTLAWGGVFTALVAMGGTGLAVKRYEASVLRAELEWARTEARALEALRTENLRRREKQIPAGELERLRSDHAALGRLRAELETLRKGP